MNRKISYKKHNDQSNQHFSCFLPFFTGSIWRISDLKITNFLICIYSDQFTCNFLCCTLELVSDQKIYHPLHQLYPQNFCLLKRKLLALKSQTLFYILKSSNFFTGYLITPEFVDDVDVEDDHNDERDDKENGRLDESIHQSRVVTPKRNTVRQIPDNIRTESFKTLIF